MAQDQNRPSNGRPRREVAARPAYGLDAALQSLDAHPMYEPYRLILRAAAAYNYGDGPAWHREMSAAVSAIRGYTGLSRDDLNRLVSTPAQYLASKAPAGVN